MRLKTETEDRFCKRFRALYITTTQEIVNPM